MKVYSPDDGLYEDVAVCAGTQVLDLGLNRKFCSRSVVLRLCLSDVQKCRTGLTLLTWKQPPVEMKSMVTRHTSSFVCLNCLRGRMQKRWSAERWQIVRAVDDKRT